ncbi:hypothetical protein [Nocardia sp. NPDC052566]|uniref:hypothetical protein n=1 Tax=Nocardia sp. NPDC052566 TaxID=3364330 RepID=UPI0037C568E5
MDEPEQLGTIGAEIIAKRVKQLRAQEGIPIAELSRHLELIGCKISPYEFDQIVDGERRIYADELLPLAYALGVSPVTLLMPDATDALDTVEDIGLTASAFWAWLRADEPFVTDSSNQRSRQHVEFVLRSHPTWKRDEYAEAIRAVQDSRGD